MPEWKALNTKNLSKTMKNEFEPICLSDQSKEIEELSNQVKEHFTLNEYITSHDDDQQVKIKEKLVKIRELCLELYEEIECEELPF